jgi:hypothetical protein
MISSSAHSPAVYREMSERAVRIIPGARLFHFAHEGHYVPQVNPEMLRDVVKEFAQVA